MELKKISGKEGRILEVLKEALNISTNKAKELLDNFFVYVNNKVVYISSYKVKKDDFIEVLLFFPKKEKGKILFENDDFLVLDKPPFIDVYELQKIYYKNYKIVHRLDKLTSGLLIFAKNEKIKKEFIDIFKEKKIKKEYRAIVYGKLDKYKKLNFPLDGKTAISYVNPINFNQNYSYLKVNILTGRKHQIRKHLSLIKHPIVKDVIYGPKIIKDKRIKKLPRFMLHAKYLEFSYKGKNFRFNADLPNDFQNALKELELV